MSNDAVGIPKDLHQTPAVMNTARWIDDTLSLWDEVPA